MTTLKERLTRKIEIDAEKWEMNKKFIEYPLIIDWLQWSEFRHSHTEPIDYPQAALTLISEMRSYIRELEGKINHEFYPEPGGQAQPNLNDNPIPEGDERDSW